MSTSRKRAYITSDSSSLSSYSSHYVGYTSLTQNRRRAALCHPSSSSNTSMYMDIGDCGCVCEFCDAYFWYDERSVNASINHRPKYSQCCRAGRVRLLLFRAYSSAIVNLYDQSDFLSNIRAYNSMLSMTSFGAKVDHSVNVSSAPYVFKIEGQIHHWLGSLCPPENEKPRFLQMYIYDTDNEVSNRLRFFDDSQLSTETITFLIKELENTNVSVKLFRSARDMYQSIETPTFAIRLYGSQTERSYDRPNSSCVGAIVSDSDTSSDGFDIVIHHRDGNPHRISKFHPLYMSLQYPLLFVYGEAGWSPNMRLHGGSSSQDQKLTMNMFYSYQLHDRLNLYTLLLRGGRLFQQYLVDAYVSIEESRLDYIRQNQNTFRSEFLQGVHDAVQRGDTDGRHIGKRTLLPSSFTGGPRYMYKHYQDALAICRVHGNPQYFITFTCNMKWPEIQRYISQFPKLKAQDRPDIIARVFQIKVNSLVNFLKTRKPFGEVAADLYTIEFQKRGLPHCHLLLWVTERYKITSAEQLDNFISAEIPDPISEPALHNAVTELMLHSPCGIIRPNAPCMKSGACSKKFPKDYQPLTSFDKNGYAQYKRRLTTHTFQKYGITVDNGYVVPYNRLLCLHYHAHINVEYCGWSMLIKYLFKYISKGADRIRYSIAKAQTTADQTQDASTSQIDEVSNFLDGRFICPHEAAWRILNFSIHCRNPAVQVLAVHLDGMQSLNFKDNDHLETILGNPNSKKTTLTEWLRNNCEDESGRHLRYIDYTQEYRWDTGGKCWIRRRSKREPAIGRLIYIHPAAGEAFYLRMLLGHQKGCQSFADIRTVSGQVAATFRDACQMLQLLENDSEWSDAFNEAATWASASELRTLFTHMLLYCEISNPLQLWHDQWSKMADDVVHSYQLINAEEQMQYVLYELELLLSSNAYSSSLSKFGLPMPNEQLLNCLRNKLLLEEKNYDRQKLAQDLRLYKSQLNCQQAEIYEHIISGLNSNRQILAFVYGHGGTNKTFLWKTIISTLRSEGKIVLAVAASGIASLLLPSGRTAHSRFKIPLDLTNESTCYISKKTHLAQLLIETSLIIWDEAPMNDSKCFESLDRTLKDLLDNNDLPFGGKSVLLGGDFRQTLPIKPKASKETILDSSLPRSYLWNKLKIFKLIENMRVQRPSLSNEQRAEITVFSSWLLAIGDGQLGIPDKDDPQNSKTIDIPAKYLIPFDENALMDLIHFIYDENTIQNPSTTMLSKKAIVCPTNETANEINMLIHNMCTGTPVSYLSTDSIIPHANTIGDPMCFIHQNTSIYWILTVYHHINSNLR